MVKIEINRKIINQKILAYEVILADIKFVFYCNLPYFKKEKMASIIGSEKPELFNHVDADILDVEDCQYLLRALGWFTVN